MGAIRRVRGENILPKITTNPTQTQIAIIPPFEIVMLPELEPAAPAFDPSSPENAASPGSDPSPGCCGVLVAIALNSDETELADISGVWETNVVGAGVVVEVIDACVCVSDVRVCDDCADTNRDCRGRRFEKRSRKENWGRGVLIMNMKKLDM